MITPIKKVSKEPGTQIVKHSYEHKIDDTVAIFGTILVDREKGSLSFTLYRTVNGIAYSEGVTENQWFLDELKRINYKQTQEKRLSSVFKKK